MFGSAVASASKASVSAPGPMVAPRSPHPPRPPLQRDRQTDKAPPPLSHAACPGRKRIALDPSPILFQPRGCTQWTPRRESFISFIQSLISLSSCTLGEWRMFAEMPVRRERSRHYAEVRWQAIATARRGERHGCKLEAIPRLQNLPCTRKWGIVPLANFATSRLVLRGIDWRHCLLKGLLAPPLDRRPQATQHPQPPHAMRV